MNRISFILLAALLLFIAACSKEKISETKILVYTKNGNGYVHDNIEASVKAIQKIGIENNFTVYASDDPGDINEENLKQYHCIILSNTNNEIFDTEEQKLAFVRYVHAGGGIVGIHSACGSEREWPWFWAMLGGKFERHPPFQTFDIKVIDHEHPSTSFLDEKWKWEDECYYLKYLNPDINILLAADLRTVEDDKKDVYPGEIFGNYFPLAWYHEFEGGRVFYTALGHKIEHYTDSTFLAHITGGIKWAVGDGCGPDYTNVKTNTIPE
ncbi:MAG TPA: ThuA domain-containing protein [Bacteroidales bacterium]|nr:ThuA domain-containing protein [Bacteroidales bacterium]